MSKVISWFCALCVCVCVCVSDQVCWELHMEKDLK